MCSEIHIKRLNTHKVCTWYCFQWNVLCLLSTWLRVYAICKCLKVHTIIMFCTLMYWIGSYVKFKTLFSFSFNRLWTMYTTTTARPGVIHDLIKQISLHLNSIHIIILTWVLGLSIALPPLLGWSYYYVEPNGLRYANKYHYLKDLHSLILLLE